MNIFLTDLHLQIDIIVNCFQAGSLVWDLILEAFWGLGAPLWHHFSDLWVQACLDLVLVTLEGLGATMS